MVDAGNGLFKAIGPKKANLINQPARVRRKG
jgi:hypothetical protein